MKTRNIALMMALVMLLSLLTACGGGKTPAQTQDPAAQSPETTAPAEEERPLSLGVLEGYTYTNTYCGLRIELDESWDIYSAEELQELPDVVTDMVEGTELEKALEGVEQITDILAENMDQLCTMNLLLQKLTTQQRIAYALMDEEAIVDATLEQKDVMIQAYSQGGIDVVTMEKVTVTYMGQEHYALKTVAQTQGLDYYILQVFDFHLGQYSMTLTLGSFVEDKTESMLDLIQPLS